MIVRVHAPDLRSREVRLWWPGPLALIIWLALVWKFSYFLTSPRVEMAASAPVQASFVELPDAAKEKSPEAQPKSLPRHSKPAIRPRPICLAQPRHGMAWHGMAWHGGSQSCASAGQDGDVERAIVRSMIELIRRYYKGDFNWESQRLDRTIVLSARMEDSAGLEDFMMREFFRRVLDLTGLRHGKAASLSQ